MTDDPYAKPLELATRLLRQAADLIDAVHDAEAEAHAPYQEDDDGSKYDVSDALYDAQEAIGEALERLDVASGLPSQWKQLGRQLNERLDVLITIGEADQKDEIERLKTELSAHRARRRAAARRASFTVVGDVL